MIARMRSPSADAVGRSHVTQPRKSMPHMIRLLCLKTIILAVSSDFGILVMKTEPFSDDDRHAPGRQHGVKSVLAGPAGGASRSPPQTSFWSWYYKHPRTMIDHLASVLNSHMFSQNMGAMCWSSLRWIREIGNLS